MLGSLRMLLLAAVCAGCGGPSVLDDGGLDAATEDAGAGSGDAGIDAGAAPDAGVPETDAGRVAIRFDDSACMAGPAHLWSEKSAMRFNGGIVHAESRPHADFVVAASFGGTIQLGTVDLTADSDGDAYVALIDAAGTFVWSQHFRGSGRQRVAGVARDGSGNVLVFGEFTEELLVGTEAKQGASRASPAMIRSGSPTTTGAATSAWSARRTTASNAASGRCYDPTGRAATRTPSSVSARASARPRGAASPWDDGLPFWC